MHWDHLEHPKHHVKVTNMFPNTTFLVPAKHQVTWALFR